MLAALDLLISLMAFSSQNNNVARLSVLDDVLDGLFPVTDGDIFPIRLLHPHNNIVNDGLGFLKPRII